jgi:hypothetical protein
VEITNEILEQIIAGKPVGEHEAYKNGSHNKIKGHIKATIHDLEQSSRIQVGVESDDYGSGYASYVDVFCYKKDGSSSHIESGTTITDGMTVYLCKLAPVAAMGALQKTRGKNSSSYSFLRPEHLNNSPSDDWAESSGTIRKTLEKNGFEILEARDMKKTMPFEANIPTILGDPPFQIFDAFFHWED